MNFFRLITRLLLPLCLAASALTAFYFLINSRTFQFYGGIVHRVETGRKVVALTFDDGPTEFTDELIEVLRSEGVKATFFLIGGLIGQHPEYGRRLAAAGHEIGNHTYSHHRMVFKDAAFIRQEVEKTDSLIRRIAPQNHILFRPPYCKKFIGLPRYLHEHRRETITWDVEPESFADVRSSADRIAAYTAAHTRPGSIILLHGMNPGDGETRKSLKALITRLKKRGYRFVTVSELLHYRKRPNAEAAGASAGSI
ncbi:polysaccharide deacetylase family protein [Larkinella soli]|uniref:polysaccharide deacetylase family protein n=1 Tax=Larkinella soli TaxID=1770527 RepID=UPI000FFB570A|nr:polysaccharide deacetylase family protein [Larkinella soli]